MLKETIEKILLEIVESLNKLELDGINEKICIEYLELKDLENKYRNAIKKLEEKEKEKEDEKEND